MNDVVSLELARRAVATRDRAAAIADEQRFSNRRCRKSGGSTDVEWLARTSKLRWQRIEEALRYLLAPLTLPTRLHDAPTRYRAVHDHARDDRIAREPPGTFNANRPTEHELSRRGARFALQRGQVSHQDKVRPLAADIGQITVVESVVHHLHQRIGATLSSRAGVVGSGWPHGSLKCRYQRCARLGIKQAIDRERAGERLGDLEPLFFVVPLVDAALPVGIDNVP
jgi:hypothetical protein